MAETFYTVLGVADDASAEAVRRAYRERVMDHHPDVADDPGAPRTFKRLTVARDVLVDQAERERYDELGHEAYVSRHVRTGVWSAGLGRVESGYRADTARRSEEAAGRVTADGAGPTGERTAWLGEDWDGPRKPRQRRGGAATDAGRGWQTVSEVYRSRPAGAAATDRPSIRDHLAAVGPWQVVYLGLVGSALATAWFTMAEIESSGSLTVPGLAVVLVAIGVAVVLSALHVFATLSA